jgi:hypothetical protein
VAILRRNAFEFGVLLTYTQEKTPTMGQASSRIGTIKAEKKATASQAPPPLPCSP